MCLILGQEQALCMQLLSCQIKGRVPCPGSFLFGALPVVEINFFCCGDNALHVCQTALRNSRGCIYNRCFYN